MRSGLFLNQQGIISGFSPSDIAGLELWYDQSDISTLWTDDGTTQVSAADDLVYRWDDKSGNGGHAKQAASASRPKYQTTGIQFDDTDDWLDNTAHVFAFYPHTMICVFSVGSGAEGQLIGLSDASATDPYARILIRNDGSVAQQLNNGATSIYDTAPTAYNDNSTHVTTVISNTQTSRELWVDGGDNQSNSTSIPDTGTAAAIDTFSIGRLSRPADGSYYGGYIMEAIVYDSALSTTDREAVEAYLSSKWGIA